MNFFDCLPEYCMTKEIVESDDVSPVQSPYVSINNQQYVTIFSFIPILSGNIHFRVVYGGVKYIQLKITDNDTTIKESRYDDSPILMKNNTVVAGHKYTFEVKADSIIQDESRLTAGVSLWFEVKDKPSLFIQEV